MIVENKLLSSERIINEYYIDSLQNVSYFIKTYVVIKEKYFIESIKRNMINYCKKYIEYAKTKSTIPLMNTEFFNKYIFFINDNLELDYDYMIIIDNNERYFELKNDLNKLFSDMKKYMTNYYPEFGTFWNIEYELFSTQIEK